MKKSVLAVTLFLATATVAQASSGTLNFNGTIRDTACSIDASDQNQTIAFGDVAKSLINGGGRSAPKPVEIKLQSCSQGTLTQIKTTLSGTAAGFEDAFGVSGVDNVGIVIEQNGKAVIPGSSVSQPLNDGDNTINFQASVIGNSATGTGTEVTEGTFSSAVNFNIEYI